MIYAFTTRLFVVLCRRMSIIYVRKLLLQSPSTYQVVASRKQSLATHAIHLLVYYHSFNKNITCFMAYTSAASEYPQPAGERELNQTSRTTTETVFNCWNTITNIGSCGNEIMDFFARGTVDHISRRCRKEINMIMRQCWPDLFIALGITSEECNFLLGFCKPSSGSSAPRPSVRYPTPPAKMKKETPAKILGTKA
ncbi:hypothetical protein POM88_003407 [Heracleum sosnowskyi]|uniref:Prolamin-like domain-containing protein n=1 Tax=Heracleum sosnowskyi TaxID=360622 RepID=A0AAD8NC99_9APIA|nr:hypothetical protein POM88_003407 [Heracleum sosnowskyi]